jgi:hypothetical protein
MLIQLSPSWILTTVHSASSYGRPVLVNKHTSKAFGPGDVVRAFPSWALMPARQAVLRMANQNPGLSPSERKRIEAFE